MVLRNISSPGSNTDPQSSPTSTDKGAGDLRGELRSSFSTKWWYENSGCNKLQAKIRAWRERYKIPLEELPDEVAKNVREAAVDGRVSYHDLVAMTPTNKTSCLLKVKQLISFHVKTHSVRSAFTYRKVLVSSLHDINDDGDLI